jgi:hypothetical protein
MNHLTPILAATITADRHRQAATSRLTRISSDRPTRRRRWRRAASRTTASRPASC